MSFTRCLLATFLLTLALRASDPPKLIVVLSYDQLRGDRLSAFKDDLSPNGFARVLREGTVYDSCFYTHAVNMTAPGHAVLLTGCDPYKTGIVGNEYIDRAAGKQKYATEDTSEVLSPRNLLRPTLGQLLKQRSPESRVIGIAIKDRAAILMTGMNADAALWLEPKSGGLGTSNHYRKPRWLHSFNAAHDLSKFAGETWKPLQAIVPPPDPKELEKQLQSVAPGSKVIPAPPPMTFSQQISFNDDAPWEGNFPGGGRAFPHVIPAYASKDFWEAFICTPYSISWIMDAARTAIREEKLGQHEHTDMLCVGISTTDEVGHIFGPNSREMKEIILSSDRELADFIDFLDKELGRQNYELVISSDHGVAEVPENTMFFMGQQCGRINRASITESLQAPFQSAVPVTLDAGKGGEVKVRTFVSNCLPPNLFLDSLAVMGVALPFSAACDTLAATLRAAKGIGYAIATHNLIEGKRPPSMDSTVFELIRHAVYAPRCGDIIFFPQRGWLYGSKTTTHGTPYDYDRHVPLMFFGGGISARRSSQSVSPADIAPTLAEQLGIIMNDVDGSSLHLR